MSRAAFANGFLHPQNYHAAAGIRFVLRQALRRPPEPNNVGGKARPSDLTARNPCQNLLSPGCRQESPCCSRGGSDLDHQRPPLPEGRAQTVDRTSSFVSPEPARSSSLE